MEIPIIIATFLFVLTLPSKATEPIYHRWNPDKHIIYYKVDHQLNLVFKTQIIEAAKRVNDLDTELFLVYAGELGSTYPTDIMIDQDYFDISAFGFTNLSYTGGYISKCRAWVNLNTINKTPQGINRYNAYYNTIAHEAFGHCLGLPHLECPGLMCSKLSTDKIYFDKKYRKALKELYPE